jgi:hypothetical protein
MKKIVSLISGVFLLTASGTALAQNDVACPDAGTVREKGTTITKGYQDTQAKDYLWDFYSVPFYDGAYMWQTIFEENLHGVTEPAIAVSKAQIDLNNYPISTYSQSYTTSDNVTVCEYVPYNTNYKVIVVNHVDATFNSLKK